MSASDEDILPNCRNDFNRYGKDNRNWPYNAYSLYCTKFCTRILCARNSQNFNRSCMDILFYLYYLNNSKTMDNFHLEQSCKYFFYKLKELLKIYGGKCGTTKDCYEKLRLKIWNVYYFGVDIPNICLQYTENNDIDEDTYTKFKNLENLYNIYGKFEERQNNCHSYTIFDSFLHSIVKKLRKIINKKRRFHQKLTDSFDKIYNYPNGNNYRIVYISES
ncbi:variable surface protein [Plasmodium gonderi]|uniref:Variable surface protein n=1 Tax=Plasmodium gonderi TaxID=77519 RepID=A0A1Y1JUW3_PLAGO|nr:variable surface protein [Plasmodium gonderi]GAW84203.1 variable surface protein [Plasmodium gonderi]